MLEKYQWISERYRELTEMISQSEVIADPKAYQTALKERSQLQEQAAAWDAYQKLLEHLSQANQMASDPDLQELAEEEIKELEKTKAEMEKQLLVLLLPKDPDRDRSVVMEIRAGAGGEEAWLHAITFVLNQFLSAIQNSAVSARQCSLFPGPAHGLF